MENGNKMKQELDKLLDIWNNEQSKGRSMTKPKLNKIIQLLTNELNALKNLNGNEDRKQIK